MSYVGYEEARGWGEAKFGTFTSDEAAYFEAELAASGVGSHADLRVLEVGFGNGSFLGWCRSRGWQCHGVEINPQLVERALKQGVVADVDVQALQEQVAGTRYDLIAAFDVLEHIDRGSLAAFVAGLRRSCHAGTLVVFRFPNGDNPFSLPLQNGDVTHLTSIGSYMVYQIAALAEFRVLQLRAPAQPRRGLSVKRMLAAVGLPARAVIGFVIRHLFMAGAPVQFSANLLVVMQAGSPSVVDSD